MKLLMVLIGMMVGATAQASVLGMLVSWSTVQTVSGQFAYDCVYLVNGQRVAFISRQICPVSMMFD